MGREVSCEDVQEDVKCAIGIKVKVANQADHSTPDRQSPLVNHLGGFDRQTRSGRVSWTNATRDFRD